MMSLYNWKKILKKELINCNTTISCTYAVINNAQRKNIRDYYIKSYFMIDEVYMRDNIRNSSFFPRNILFDLHGSYPILPCKSINNTIKDIYLPKIYNYMNQYSNSF